jgi:hypothetical protein
VLVPVMQIGIVVMRVHEALVPVRMTVWLARRIIRCMRVAMVLVVDVHMRVFHLIMHVRVLVSFGEVQPHTRRHARTSNPEQSARMFPPC